MLRPITADWTASATDNGVTTTYGYDAAGQQRTQAHYTD